MYKNIRIRIVFMWVKNIADCSNNFRHLLFAWMFVWLFLPEHKFRAASGHKMYLGYGQIKSKLKSGGI